jgi:serine phosphatase RsbU (regulator of sigma subunit)
VSAAGDDRRFATRSRERFLEGEPVETGVRGLILSSWQRCQFLGLSPNGCAPVLVQDFDAESRLVRAAVPVLDRMAAEVADTRVTFALTNEDGTVLRRRFGQTSMRRSYSYPLGPGWNFAERFAGTNSIGVALAERRPSIVFGSEHFSELFQQGVCMASPLRDPLSGRIEGLIDLTCPSADLSPAMGALMRWASQTVEQRLLEESSEHERALLEVYQQAKRLAQTRGAIDVIGVDDLTQSGLSRRDQVILMGRAAELIAAGGWGSASVHLPSGREAALLSRPVTSPSGTGGVAVEVVLPASAPQNGGSAAEYDAPTQLWVGNTESGTTAPQPDMRSLVPPVHETPPPPMVLDPFSGTLGPGPDGPAGSGGGRLLLVGEPRVGRLAVAARRRLELLSEASTRIGTTLDVARTAEELARMAVPRFADFVTIDLPDAVLRGDESADPATDLRRTVVHGVDDDCPFYPAGEKVHLVASTPHQRCLATGEAVLEPDLTCAAGWLSQDPEHGRRLLDHHLQCLITTPLRARGVVLGIAAFYRSQRSEPFTDDDCSLAVELATRAALCIDNARRYTREHSVALALQRSLLPQGVPEQSAVEAAYRYQPAESGVGGDWFDVIPLSGARVALVVGDVVGHGLRAAVTMGRLRTAVQNFAAMDLTPDEVLTQLDDLVARLDRDEAEDAPGSPGVEIMGATCLYAIYDPTSRECTLGRAGHPLPAVVHPDGTVTFPELPACPPLGLGGLGGLPFETATILLPEGSHIVLYTDGLIEGRHRDPDAVLDQLRDALAHPGRSPEDNCRAIMDAVLPAHPSDDVALLVARTQALDPRHVVTWDLPDDDAAVSGIRAAATRQLDQWGLDEATFTTELILSELSTNAIRYGAGPRQVRLIFDRTLICEVSDASSTAPHLRRAAMTDEGGRGLFLVAQLAQTWGTRYSDRGKTIWADQPLPQ